MFLCTIIGNSRKLENENFVLSLCANGNKIIPTFFHFIENQDQKLTTSLPLWFSHDSSVSASLPPLIFYFSPIVFSQDLIGY